MKRNLYVVLMIGIVLAISVYGAETIREVVKEDELPVLKEALESKKKEVPAEVLPVRSVNVLPESVAKPVVWVAENAVKPDGWQLTGYSSLKLTRDNKIFRWKIGIINPEIDAWRYEQNQWRDFERWQDRVNRRESEVVFGFHLMWEF